MWIRISRRGGEAVWPADRSPPKHLAIALNIFSLIFVPLQYLLIIIVETCVLSKKGIYFLSP